jgi:hypothetical protein
MIDDWWWKFWWSWFFDEHGMSPFDNVRSELMFRLESSCKGKTGMIIYMLNVDVEQDL